MSKPNRFIRWCAAFDNHGDLIDPITRKAFWEFLKWWKPTHRIHGGDCFDFRWLRGRGSEQEKREKTQADFDAGIAFLKGYEPNVFLRGNHDERLWRAAESDDGKLADLAGYMIADIEAAIPAECIVYPYNKRDGVHQHGKLRFVHGFTTGAYAAKAAAMHYGNVVMGHVHASDAASIPRVERTVGHTSGCLCKVDLDYNAAQPNTLRQSNGWVYGISFPASGDFVVWHADRIGDSFYLPSEWREVR